MKSSEPPVKRAYKRAVKAKRKLDRLIARGARARRVRRQAERAIRAMERHSALRDVRIEPRPIVVDSSDGAEH